MPRTTTTADTSKPATPPRPKPRRKPRAKKPVMTAKAVAERRAAILARYEFPKTPSGQEKLWLTQQEVARILHLSAQTLRKHREMRIGLPFRQLPGAHPSYHIEDVQAYLVDAHVDPDRQGAVS